MSTLTIFLIVWYLIGFICSILFQSNQKMNIGDLIIVMGFGFMGLIVPILAFLDYKDYEWWNKSIYTPKNERLHKKSIPRKH